jgi:hypothetical protein
VTVRATASGPRGGASAAIPRLLLAVAVGSGVAAHPALGGERWPSAALSGSDRLLAHALLRDRPRGGIGAAAGALRRAGVLDPRGGRLERVSGRVSVAPAIGWDDNVNGGVPGATLGLGPFVLTVDEDSRARSGLTVGLDAAAEGGWAAGGATLLTMQAGVSWRHAPAHDIGWQAGLLRGCASRMIVAWRWIEGCAAVSGIDRELSSTAARRLELRHVALRDGRWTSRETAVGLWLEDRDGSVQPGVSGRIHAASDAGLVEAFVLAGTQPEGRSAVVAAGGVGLTRTVWGEASRVAIGFAVERGPAVFGTDREDRVATLDLARPVADGVVARIGLTRRSSSVDLFDEDLGLSFALQFRGWSS